MHGPMNVKFVEATFEIESRLFSLILILAKKGRQLYLGLWHYGTSHIPARTSVKIEHLMILHEENELHCIAQA
jgi:hypothetical protein